MCDQRKSRGHGEVLNSDDVDQLSDTDESDPEERPTRALFDLELDHSDDGDDDDEGEAEVCAPAPPSSFSLSGGSSAFSDRSHSIFDCLDSVERRTVSSLNQQNAADCPRPPPPSRKTRHPPSCPTPPKKRGIPDYLVHPERWTRYSLEDVTETSDRDNRRAAHHFLSSLQKEKKDEPSCDLQQKMIFSRPKAQKEQAADPLPATRGKEKGMHLSHLEEEGEDEEGGGRRAGQSAEKTEDKEKEDEEKDTSAAVGEVVEEEEKQVTIEEACPSFTSFRKTKGKNYRRSSGCEDN